jgi:hypothetical protein
MSSLHHILQDAHGGSKLTAADGTDRALVECHLPCALFHKREKGAGGVDTEDNLTDAGTDAGTDTGSVTSEKARGGSSLIPKPARRSDIKRKPPGAGRASAVRPYLGPCLRPL